MPDINSILLRTKEKKQLEVKALYDSGKAEKYKVFALNDPSRKDFSAAISRSGHFNLIAEFKRASPLSGNIRPNANCIDVAEAYQESGAVAISVLTDSHFKGNLYHLKGIEEKVSVPLLRKDFILDPTQIYESRVYGADAILLIAALLDPSQIKKYIAIADSLGMDCLVESHNESELEKSIMGGAKILGINNRNLNDFSVDRNTTLRLLQSVPRWCSVVTESGISNYDHVKELLHSRINAMLVGEAIMDAKSNPTIVDMQNKIYELRGNPA